MSAQHGKSGSGSLFRWMRCGAPTARAPVSRPEKMGGLPIARHHPATVSECRPADDHGVCRLAELHGSGAFFGAVPIMVAHAKVRKALSLPATLRATGRAG